MPGEFGARKLRKIRKRNRLRETKYKNRVFQLKKRKPFVGAPQAKGIVIEKKGVEQKQPHSGIIKCVRVRLLKNGKEITAHVPRTDAIKYINEHDNVLLEGLGGSQGGAIGSMWGVKYKVVAVNNVPLEMIRIGKKQKPVK